MRVSSHVCGAMARANQIKHRCLTSVLVKPQATVLAKKLHPGCSTSACIYGQSVRYNGTNQPSSRKKRKAAPQVVDLTAVIGRGHELIEKFKRAVEPMIPLNDPFEIIQEQDSLRIFLGDRKGTFILAIDREELNVRLTSPVSGVITYEYDDASGQWLSNQDGHDIRGIITRDMIRICTGYPKFD